MESLSSEEKLTGNLFSLKYPKCYPGSKCYYSVKFNSIHTCKAPTILQMLDKHRDNNINKAINALKVNSREIKSGPQKKILKGSN